MDCENWMSALPEELWDVPLTDLAIPGTPNLNFTEQLYLYGVECLNNVLFPKSLHDRMIY